VALAQLRQDVEAFAIGQVQVEQDETTSGCSATRRIACRAVGRLDDRRVVFQFLQDAAQARESRVIVDDENLHLCGGFSGLEGYNAPAMALPTSWVEPSPPISRVRGPSVSTARWRARSQRPRLVSEVVEHHRARPDLPDGMAMFLP